MKFVLFPERSPPLVLTLAWFGRRSQCFNRYMMIDSNRICLFTNPSLLVEMSSSFEVESARKHFPALDSAQTYFDNAGGSQVLGDVIKSYDLSKKWRLKKINRINHRSGYPSIFRIRMCSLGQHTM
jgi:hypothetical protein